MTAKWPEKNSGKLLQLVSKPQLAQTQFKRSVLMSKTTDCPKLSLDVTVQFNLIGKRPVWPCFANSNNPETPKVFFSQFGDVDSHLPGWKTAACRRR